VGKAFGPDVVERFLKLNNLGVFMISIIHFPSPFHLCPFIFFYQQLSIESKLLCCSFISLATKTDLVIRSHEVRDEGYDIEANGKLITVFSAPNYCDQVTSRLSSFYVFLLPFG